MAQATRSAANHAPASMVGRALRLKAGETHSTLLGMLMHASLTTSMILLGPVVSGAEAMAYNLAFGAALWLLALAGAARMASESRARPV